MCRIFGWLAPNLEQTACNRGRKNRSYQRDFWPAVWLSGTAAACSKNQTRRPLFLPVNTRPTPEKNPWIEGQAIRLACLFCFTGTPVDTPKHPENPIFVDDRFGQRHTNSAETNQQQATTPLIVIIILSHCNNEALSPFLHHPDCHAQSGCSECRRQTSPQSLRWQQGRQTRTRPTTRHCTDKLHRRR